MRTYVNINKVLGIAAIVGFGIFIVKKVVDETKTKKEVEEYRKDAIKKENVEEAIDQASVKNEKIVNAVDRAAAREVLYSLKSEVEAAKTKEEVDTSIQRFRTVCDGFINDNEVVTLSLIQFYQKRAEKAAAAASQARSEALKREEIKAYTDAFKGVVRTVGTYM